MPDYIPWEEARDFAARHALRQVIITAWDGENTHVITFGESVIDSDQAAEGGNRIKAALGWPDSLNATSPKVEALRRQIHDARDVVAGLSNQLHYVLRLAEGGRSRPTPGPTRWPRSGRPGPGRPGSTRRAWPR